MVSYFCAGNCKKSVHDEVVASRTNIAVRPHYRGEVVRMTDYEIVMILIAIIGLPVSFGTLLFALLTYLDKRYGKRK